MRENAQAWLLGPSGAEGGSAALEQAIERFAASAAEFEFRSAVAWLDVAFGLVDLFGVEAADAT